ncbi:MAG TPA: histidinol dehydrogenase [Methylomusa anaerophila]|uniref:Histidinol dehydrogenase n=1 Tax=Methylomusa anaerophila TaxID=1930071 RepID=A0A348AMQ7_9FIRM|nr:histidinol dehydrogenase [Methylomusa anaerophila]BBB92355.1 histidinol dehydrogenase [Methylomusa anaerophila]HML90006.1 histidinol dehydrogenase [Methylomusa anaerophila]
MKTIYNGFLTKEEMAEVLEKPSFDKVVLSSGVRAKISEMFGKEMTAQEVVAQIIEEVRKQGDEAILRYTSVIDGVDLTADTLAVSEADIDQAMETIDKSVLAALEQAVVNVRRFHAEQMPKSWLTERNHGAMLGQKCLPIDRVGIYVPGGTAAYPSSVIMNAVPAAVAGVKEIIMVVPPAKDGTVNPYVLAAARLANVTRIFKLGGAQAIAALAFGTKTVPKVDKITGPGNLFVTLAKKAVYGHCDIDMLAGPSEILIVADDTADPAYVAADMLSQAEHDPLASSILITDSRELAGKVTGEVKRQLELLPRKDIAAESIEENGLIIIASDMMEAMELANLSAPEHLEILTAEPFKLLPYVRHAGAVFLGPYSPEPLGDYFAGPNHILPTGGTARFYSVLNVETFMKKTSIIAYTQAAFQEVSEQVIRLAEAEGLDAHANAVRVRRS